MSTRNVLELLKESLRRLKLQGQLASIADLGPLSSLASADPASSVVFVQLDETGDSLRKASPALSFVARGTDIKAFASSLELEEYVLSQYGQDWERSVVLKTQHYSVLTTDKLDRKVIRRALTDIVELFYEISIYRINIDRDESARLRSLVAQAINDIGRNRAADLPALIEKQIGLEAVILNVRQREFSLEPEKGIDRALQRLRLLFAEGQLSSTVTDSIDQSSPSYNLAHGKQVATGSIWVAIRAALQFKKLQYVDLNAPVFSHARFIVVPVSPQFLYTNGREEPRPRNLLIVSSTEGFTKTQLSCVQAFVDEHTQRRGTIHRVEGLIAIRGRLRELTNLQHDSTNVTYQYLENLFAAFCDEVGSLIIETTAAYSATVRLYEHSTLSLRTVSSKFDTDGGHDHNETKGDISIPKSRYTSINAFVYTQAFGKLDHVYIGNLVSGRVIEKIRIPKEYRLLGLQGALRARHTSRSELCICLKYKSIPIGTMNIESPLDKAFDGDFEYLNALRENIQEAFERTIGYYDIKIFSVQIRSHAAIHELDQYIRLKFFENKQAEKLNKLFRLRAPTTKRIATLAEEISEWIDELYFQQMETTRSDILSLLRINSLSEQRLSDDHGAGLLFIIKNLIQNIVAHGNMTTNFVIIDDRPQYGIGEASEVRIVCRQSAIRDEKILQRLCIAPIYDGSREYRFGMLLIGLIAKTLGGIVFVNRDSYSRFTDLLVRIPYSK